MFAAIAGALIGGAMQNRAAKKAANAQMQAAQLQAEASRFRPYNVTTGLGKSLFDTENDTATYELDPRLRTAQDTMFQLGKQALPETVDPSQAAQELYDSYQAMSAPQRERTFAQLQNSQFNNGTLGLAYGATQSGLGASNPALEAYLNAQNMADQQMFLNAQGTARDYLNNDLARAQGLFTSGIGMEAPGMDALNAGMAIGGRATAASTAAGNALAQGMVGAAQTRLGGTMNLIDSVTKGFTQFAGSPSMQGAQNPLSGLFSGWGNSQASSGGGFSGGGYGSIGSSGYTAT